MIFRTITDESTGATKSIGLFGKSLSELKTILSSLKTNGIINTFFNTSAIDEEAIIDYNIEISKAISNNATMAEKQQIMKAAMKGTNKETAQLIGTTNGATVSTDTLTAAQHSSTLAARAQAVALKAVSIAGNMIAMWAITKLIDFAATRLDNLANASKHATENAKELTSKMNNSISSLSGNASTLSELNDEYQTLSKGVNQLGENIGLSTEDYNRYKNIVSQLSEIMPNLTMYFNAQGEKIAFAKGKLADLNKEYENYIKNQAVNYVTKGDSEGNKVSA